MRTVSYDIFSSLSRQYQPLPTITFSALVVTGTATTTGNGGPAPFEAKGPSTLQVCIMGGSQVVYSNVTLVYTGPATGHFGTQPIHGVVRAASIN